MAVQVTAVRRHSCCVVSASFFDCPPSEAPTAGSHSNSVWNP